MTTKSNRKKATAKKSSVRAQESADAIDGAYNEDADKEWSRDIWLMTRPELEQHFNAITDCDEQAAHALAVYVVKFMDALAEGPHGVMKASNSLRDSAELLYLQSNSHHVAFELFLESIRHSLQSRDEAMEKFRGKVSESLSNHRADDRQNVKPRDRTDTDGKSKQPVIPRTSTEAKSQVEAEAAR